MYKAKEEKGFLSSGLYYEWVHLKKKLFVKTLTETVS